jgi:hypothetical protein
VDLHEIEEEAEAFVETREELEEVEDELEEVLTELRDAPKKAARETKFAEFVGAESTSEEELEALEDRKEELVDRREDLTLELEERREGLMRAWVHDDLVVPLTTDPEKRDHEWVFSFRDGETFPHAMGFLSDTIGLGRPIRVEDALIDEEAVRIPIEEFGYDESEAMEAVIDAFEQLQNTLELKLPDDDGW